MQPALHGEHGDVIDLADHQPAGMTLRRRAHKTRYVLVRNTYSILKIVSETTETAAEHNRNAWLNCCSRSDDPRSMLGAFVNISACHSLNHFPKLRLFLFLIGDTQGTRWPGRSNKAREHHNG